MTASPQYPVTPSQQAAPTVAGDRVAFDLEPAVGYPLRVYLSPWDSTTPLGWESRVADAPVASGTFLAPSGIGWEMLLATHGHRLLRGMPDTVRSTIATAPFLGVELAQVCGQLKAARGLATTSPLLLILLVDDADGQAWTQARFARRLAQKQTTLCASVGLPGNKSCARLLRRLALRPLIRRELGELKRVLQRPEDVALLRHHESVCLEHLLFLARHDGPRWPGLLVLIDEAMEEQRLPPGRGAWLRMLLDDVQRMLAGNLQALHRINGLEALQELHDRRVQRFNDRITLVGRAERAEALQKEHGDYPEPPLPGNDEVTPVTSWEALLQEGQRMRHCVGAYHHAVAAGQMAIYHLHGPQALTVALRPRGSRWLLGEAKGKCNAQPAAAALAQVQSWLERATP